MKQIVLGARTTNQAVSIFSVTRAIDHTLGEADCTELEKMIFFFAYGIFNLCHGQALMKLLHDPLKFLGINHFIH